LTLAGADAVTLTTTATTNVTLPTTGTLAITTITDLLAPLASPTFTGLVTFDSSITMGTFGDATQTVLPESSSNTNTLLGVYPMVNFAATAGKVFAGNYSRLLAITTAQTNQATMVGSESQIRVKGVNLAAGVHAGIWAYAEQSGTTVLSGGGTFDAISATVESSADFSAGATESVTGITLESSINSGATFNADINFSAVNISASGKEWKTGIKIADVDSIDIAFQGGATIDNEQADTLRLVETIVKVGGTLYVTGDISSGGTTSDYAITDEQLPFDEYWAKTLELNKLPAFENIDRTNIVRYINGLEESNERLLRYVVDMEARLKTLEQN